MFRRIVEAVRNFDPGVVLIGASLAIQIPRFTYAFLQTDADIGHVAVATFTGPGFAILVAGGAYYCWDTFHYVSIKASKASKLYQFRWVVLVFMALQILMEPLIAWPPIISTLREISLPTILEQYGVLVLWSLLVAAVPTIVLAGVSVSHAMRRMLTEDARARQSRKQQRNPLAPPTPATNTFYKICPICQREFFSGRAYAGHNKDARHRKVRELLTAGELLQQGESIVNKDGSPFDFETFA